MVMTVNSLVPHYGGILLLISVITGCSKQPQTAQPLPPTLPTATEHPEPERESAQPPVAPPVVKTPKPAPNRAPNPSEWVALLAGNELNQRNRVPKNISDQDWSLSDGILSCRSEKHGWLVSREEFSDFELEFEFQLVEAANSGLHFHYSGRGELSASSVEIQIIEDATYPGTLKPTQRTGAVWGRVPPSKSAMKPVGEWNKMRILVQGNLVQVTLNGESIVDVLISDLRDRPTGHLAISNWRGDANGCAFRAMRIRTL